MLGQNDLHPGLVEPRRAGTSDDAPVVDPEDALPRIVVGSVTARALYRVWSGQPVTVVDSPPGAGKSTLIRDVVALLVTRSDITVAVTTFTWEQAKDIAGRIAATGPRPGSPSSRSTHSPAPTGSPHTPPPPDGSA
jgi:hypothetical protein